MNAKIMAMMMVGVMMFSGLAITMGNEENTLDAVVGDGGAYSYTLTYDANLMTTTDAAQGSQLTVDGMTPISHASGSNTFTSLANEGSWGFNTTTGIGPFNSFYAAFDMVNDNEFVSILNPYDLTKKIDGTSLGDMSDYNIMWVLPTVYWSVSNGNVTLTNDPNSGGIAYAHTIDGVVRNYVAYGVYEGTTKTVSGQTVLTSTTGGTPASNSTLTNLRTYANNNSVDSLDITNRPANAMLMNYLQYELYKLCCFVVTEGFNTQLIVGGGMTSGAISAATGQCDALGPYAGKPLNVDYNDSPVKLFIENLWGGVNDVFDGCIITGTGVYLDSSSEPSNSTSGDYVTFIEQTPPSSGFGTAISVDPRLWGLPTSTNSGDTYGDRGTTDYVFMPSSSSSDSYIVNIPSYNSYNPAWGIRFGLSSGYYNNPVTSNYFDGRLVFVYDVLQSANVTVIDDASGYGTVNSAGPIAVDLGETIAVNGSNLTIGDTTVTATPTADTAQYDYSFTGWYDGSTQLVGGETVGGDMTITATFARSLNDYTVTASASSYGSVSPASVTQPYGSAISASGNVLTIGSQTITATPDAADAQYTYTFTGWSTFPSTLTANTSVTANFDRTVNTYTITWSISGSTTSETLPYGAMPEHEDPVPPEGYLFAGWNPEIAAVTGDQTYTAVFEEIVYITVTFDPNGGQLEGSATKSVGIGTPYGELPTPKKDNNKFLGWFTDPEEGTQVTADTIVPEDADQTLYAHWELTGFAAMLKPLLFLFPLILLAFLAIALVRTFA